MSIPLDSLDSSCRWIPMCSKTTPGPEGVESIALEAGFRSRVVSAEEASEIAYTRVSVNRRCWRVIKPKRRDRPSQPRGCKKQMSGYQLGNVYVVGILYPKDIRRTRAESCGGVFVVRRIIASFKQALPPQKLSAGINGRACTRESDTLQR